MHYIQRRSTVWTTFRTLILVDLMAHWFSDRAYDFVLTKYDRKSHNFERKPIGRKNWTAI